MGFTFRPITIIILMFTEAFMQRALLSALFLAPLCALLGVFVTARRMAFFSDTISHAALAGVALGFWWGIADPTVPLILFSVFIAASMMWLKEKTELLTDSIMALLLSGSVAFGVIILSLLEGHRADLHRFLFGDILAVSWPDVWSAAGLLAIVSAGVFLRFSSLTLLTANEEIAYVSGISVRQMNYAFVLVLTLTVALTIRLLGIMLVTSLLVIPAAAARNISRNLRQQIVCSVVIGLVSGFAGTAAAYQLNIPCGPAIVMTSIAVFILSIFVSFFRNRSGSAHETSTSR